MSIYEKIKKSAEYLNDKFATAHDIGIILGSGLGVLADEIEDAVEVAYSKIPNFPVSTVEGHEGKLVSGRLYDKRILVMKGRFHYYEGYNMDDVTFPVRVMKLLNINNLLLTNAAGGINKDFEPGDLMLIKDHIKFFDENPLRGENINEFGPRFNDMSCAYPEYLRRMAKDVAAGLGINVREGVYAYMPGPSYETPAEIRMLRVLGADAVGMSTVPEVIVAAHAGIKVLGISCISNMASGILEKPLSHAEVIETAAKVRDKFILLVKNIIKEWKVER